MLRILKKIIQKPLNLLGYRIASNYDSVIDQDKDFLKIYEHCKSFTMTTKERMYALYKATEYVVNAGIKGDFVECGVWRGGSIMVIAETLLSMGVKDRKLWLYDTFEGMTEQTKEDVHVENPSVTEYQKSDVDLEEVQKNVFLSNYPKENFAFIKGKVEDTLPAKMPSKIALLRLDTDWYESTKHELIHLFPLVSGSGVLIVDDYGAWAGSKKAVDEYFSDKPMLLNRIDRDSRIGIKI